MVDGIDVRRLFVESPRERFQRGIAERVARGRRARSREAIVFRTEQARAATRRQQSNIRRGQVRRQSVVFTPKKVDLPDISKVTLDPTAFALGITATSPAAIAKKIRDLAKQTGKSAAQVSRERQEVLDQVKALKKQQKVSTELTKDQAKLLADQKNLKNIQSVLSNKEFLTETDVILFDKQVKKFESARSRFEADVKKSNKEFETLQKLAQTGLLAAQAGRLAKFRIEEKRLIKQEKELKEDLEELERRGAKIEDIEEVKEKIAVVKELQKEKAKKKPPKEPEKPKGFELKAQVKDIAGIPKALVEIVAGVPKRVKGVFEAEIKPEFKGKPLEEFIGGAGKFPVAVLEATFGTIGLAAEETFKRVFPRGVAVKIKTGKLEAFKTITQDVSGLPFVGKFLERPIKSVITEKGEIEISRRAAPAVGFVAPFFVGVPGLKGIGKVSSKFVSKSKAGLGSVVSKVTAKVTKAFPKKLTKLEIRKIVQEAAREPPTFPLGVKPRIPLAPTLPIGAQKAFKITKKFIQTEARIKAGIPEQAIKSFKVSEVIPNIEKTRFVQDLAKEFGVSKGTIVKILKEETIVSTKGLRGEGFFDVPPSLRGKVTLLGVEVAPSKILKGKTAFIDISKRGFPATIKHELTHAVQRKLGFKGTQAQIEAQARKAERFGGPAIVEGPKFPLTFKPKEPSFEGLTKVTPTKIKPLKLETAGLVKTKPLKEKPPKLDTVGLTKIKVDEAAARLRAETLREAQPFGVREKIKQRIFREKPLPFESQQQKATTITVQKQKVKTFKPKAKVGRVDFKRSTEEVARSTQEFAPSTQKFRKRFFEETQRRPLQEFVPKEARVPRTARVSFPGIKTTFAEDTKLVEGLIPKVGTIEIAKQFEKARTDFAKGTTPKTITSVGTKVGDAIKSASSTAEKLKPAAKTADALKLKSPQRILPKTTTRLVTRITPRPKEITKPTKITKPKTPPVAILLPDKDAIKKKKKRVPGFHAFVKEEPFKTSKFRKVSKKPRPLANILERSFKVADNTISQTTEARPTKTLVPPEPPPKKSLKRKFREVKVSGKKKRFIEKRAHAIDTLGEKQKLKVSAFLARERKRAKGLPTKKTKGFKKSKRKGGFF